MRPSFPRYARALLPLALLAADGCASSQSLHPAPPPHEDAVPLADPSPSRIVVHATILAESLSAQLEAALPREGKGDVPIVGKQAVAYRWTRQPVKVRFDRGRILVDTDAMGYVRLLGEHAIPLHIAVAAEPIIRADYRAELQSTEVKVTASSSLDTVNHPLEDKLRTVLLGLLEGFRLDLRPLIEGVYQRVSRPLPVDVLGRKACAELRVTGIEAGPSVYAGGLEKDLGIVIMPSVTLPCAEKPEAPRPMPLLENVAVVPPGPWKVRVPIAADYAELSRAMENAMGGQLHFSKEYPDLYLEKPAVYPSRDTIVIKILLGGRVRAGAIETGLSGELFLSGHPQVVDNQIVVPDLELTPGTADGLLKLKFLLDGRGIRDQAQAALRVDLSERIHAVQGKLGTELSFSQDLGCARAEVLRTEVTSIHPHANFLRIYVDLDGQAGLYLPCTR